MPHKDALRFADILPVMRAQFVVAVAEAVSFGMADLKNDQKAIAAWEQLNRQANSRPIFPTASTGEVMSEEAAIANFNRDLWLAQMLESGIRVPASLRERVNEDGGS